MSHSLERYGTIAFDADFMERMIGVGVAMMSEHGEFLGFDARRDPTIVNVAVWLGFVPEAYRAAVRRAVEEVGNGFVGCKLDENAIRSFRVELQAWVWANIEPRA